jgi:hypothetical protein
VPELSREERWLAIPGWDGWYEVSDHGRVRSVPRTVRLRAGHSRSFQSRYLKLNNLRGYLRVCLRRNGEGSWVFVHRLVLEAFRGSAPVGMVGCHNDGNSVNCRLENLRWDTQTNNLLDAVLAGNHWQVRKRVCPLDHRLEHPNLVRSQLTIPGRRGGRSCLACCRTHALRSKGATEFDFKVVADAKYEKIMCGEMER